MHAEGGRRNVRPPVASAFPDPPPPRRFPARAALRSATADAHARVDAAFGSLDLASADGYRRFLAAQGAAFLPAEAALERHGVATVIPDWAERRRGDQLRADLGALGLTVPALPAPRFATPAALCGAAYVLEGSRLGGAMLVRGVPAGFPTSFLAAPATPGAWRALLDLLDTVVVDDTTRDEAIAAALAVFTLFESAAHG